jgi:hypothetical protein
MVRHTSCKRRETRGTTFAPSSEKSHGETHQLLGKREREGEGRRHEVCGEAAGEVDRYVRWLRCISTFTYLMVQVLTLVRCGHQG